VACGLAGDGPGDSRTGSPFFYAPGQPVHGAFISSSRILRYMGDFLAVLGIIAFAVVMLGLIWGLDHV
jgi:hypothetical protein